MLNQLRKRRDQGGFTLIELLIVIIILGILAAVVVLSINAIRDRGAQSACETEGEQIRTALAGYYSDSGTYPTELTNVELRSFLDKAPSASSWSFTTSGGSYSLSGIGDCDTVGPLSPTTGV